jgi:hypothetical protein
VSIDACSQTTIRELWGPDFARELAKELANAQLTSLTANQDRFSSQGKAEGAVDTVSIMRVISAETGRAVRLDEDSFHGEKGIVVSVLPPVFFPDGTGAELFL